MEAKILRIDRIFSGYKNREVLQGVSIDIAKGDTIAVIGQNGAGKSTLLKAIMGFLAVRKGSIHLNGEEITNQSPYTLRQKGVGYFMQGGRVFPHLNLQENLEVANNQLTKKTLKNRINQMSELLPLLKRRNLKTQASSLSGGERHQLALGMLLMSDLDLLLLDEPSSGLSPSNVDNIYKILAKAKAERGMSILLIEQKVTEAVKFSDQVCLLKNGRIEKREDAKHLESIVDIGKFFFGGL
jgi:ABC-type branched-subunit amino acid transport system ATPase component